MQRVMLGPFFTTTAARRPGCGKLLPLGVAMEWATPVKTNRITLFRHCRPYAQDRARFEEIVFRRSDLPCDMDCQAYQALDTPEGVFLPLDALLAVQYRNCEVARSIFEVLKELSGFVPLRSTVTNPVTARELLRPNAEAQGFRLNTVFTESETVYAHIAWEPACGATRFHVGVASFHSTSNQNLDDGKWVVPRNIGVSQLLAKELQRLAPGYPRDLLSEAGLQFLEATFRG